MDVPFDDVAQDYGDHSREIMLWPPHLCDTFFPGIRTWNGGLGPDQTFVL